MPDTNAINTLINHPYCEAIRDALSPDEAIKLYLVGGMVRDALHKGTISDDIDMVSVGISAKTIGETLASKLNGRYVPLHEDVINNNIDWHIVRVVWWPDGRDEAPVSIDIADSIGGNIDEDLKRRDLTINAMAINLANSKLLDPYDGAEDLKNKRVKALSEDNLIDDPLRLLRVYRFAAQLNAKSIDPDTEQWVATHVSKLANVAPERLQQELMKLLATPNSAPWLQAMAGNGLLQTMMPEWHDLPNVPPNSHHHLRLDHHTLELVTQLENDVFAQLPDKWQQYLTSKPAPNSCNHKAIITLACLLHDIGKPATHIITEEGRHTFYGHERVGEDITAVIAKRLKLPKHVSEPLKLLVRWHLYPCAFGEDSPQKSIHRFYRRLGNWVPDVLILAMADRLATQGPDVTEADIKQAMDDCHFLLAGYPEFATQNQTLPLVTGKDIMQALSLQPGPAIGQWVNAVRERQLLGELATRNDALNWLIEANRSKKR